MKAAKVAIAALAGFTAGILLAPKSGKETRADIKQKAEEAKDKASEKSHQVKGAMKDGYKSVRTGAGHVADEVKDFGRSARTSADGLASEAKTRAGRVADEAKSTRRSVKEDIDKNR